MINFSLSLYDFSLVRTKASWISFRGLNKEAMAASTSNYDLYINTYSICSIMVEYTIALRGEPKDAESDMPIVLHDVDLFRTEQLTEAFLTEINPEGQVREHTE